MKRRMILMLAAVGIFVATIAAVKTRQIQSAIKQHASFQPPPEAVTTVVAKRSSGRRRGARSAPSPPSTA